MSGSYLYFACLVFAFCGLLISISSSNMVKKMMGLSICQTSVIFFFIAMSYVENAVLPFTSTSGKPYINPLPHVLMLTAIVVGVALTSLGFSIIIRIKEEFGSVSENDFDQG